MMEDLHDSEHTYTKMHQWLHTQVGLPASLPGTEVASAASFTLLCSDPIYHDNEQKNIKKTGKANCVDRPHQKMITSAFPQVVSSRSCRCDCINDLPRRWHFKRQNWRHFDDFVVLLAAIHRTKIIESMIMALMKWASPVQSKRVEGKETNKMLSR